MQKTIAWNTASQLLARGVSAAATFIITLVLARRFGAAGLGDFVKITTFLSFFYLIADFGLNAIYLRENSSWEDLLMLRTVLSGALVVIASCVLTLFPYGSAQGYTSFVRIGIILFAPSIVFQALMTTSNALFQKHLRYDMSTVAISAGSIVSVALLFFVVRQPEPSTGVLFAVLSLLAGGAVAAGTGLLLTRRFHRVVHSVISKSGMRSLFVASIPLGVTLMFNLVYFRVDSIILTLTRTTAEVGVYGLAYKVFELFLVFPTFFMNSVYPIMIRSDSRLPRLVGRSALFLGALSIAATIIFWFGAPVISWIRSDFAAGVGAARILALGLPFFFLSSLAMWILIAKKQQLLLAAIYGVSMIVNIVLNILFIPSYGYMAAAWITGISEAIVLVASGAAAVKLLSL